jgi:hypothetical protein
MNTPSMLIVAGMAVCILAELLGLVAYLAFKLL